VTVETNQNWVVGPAVKMSSNIPSYESAAHFNLRERRWCLRSAGLLQKANRNRHNSTGGRRPKFATAMQRPTPICA